MARRKRQFLVTFGNFTSSGLQISPKHYSHNLNSMEELALPKYTNIWQPKYLQKTYNAKNNYKMTNHRNKRKTAHTCLAEEQSPAGKNHPSQTQHLNLICFWKAGAFSRDYEHVLSSNEMSRKGTTKLTLNVTKNSREHMLQNDERKTHRHARLQEGPPLFEYTCVVNSTWMMSHLFCFSVHMLWLIQKNFISCCFVTAARLPAALFFDHFSFVVGFLFTD